MLWIWAIVATLGLLWLVFVFPNLARIPEEWGKERAKLPVLPADRLVLTPLSFADLSGWLADPLGGAAVALRRSCERWRGRSENSSLGGDGVAGVVSDWRPFCSAVERLPGADSGALRRVIETHLRPYQVKNNQFEEGLFTGYYEPTLRGRWRRSERFNIPLYKKPGGMIEADLGAFREEWKGQRLVGRLRGGRLEPFPDRAAIDRGALRAQGLELLWVDDPVDAFFLQIQGSGRVTLPGGSEIRLGYAGQNGHPYFAIGRALIDRGALEAKAVSMQSIRAWLVAHPGEANELMALNRSFVFFRELEGEGPLGSLGVPLTAERSLAVDRTFIPLGVPAWIETTAPAIDPDEPETLFQRLVVAQDTGGAIRGPVRGDVFWGASAEAAEIAGRMKSRGRLFLLLPARVTVAGKTTAADG